MYKIIQGFLSVLVITPAGVSPPHLSISLHVFTFLECSGAYLVKSPRTWNVSGFRGVFKAQGRLRCCCCKFPHCLSLPMNSLPVTPPPSPHNLEAWPDALRPVIASGWDCGDVAPGRIKYEMKEAEMDIGVKNDGNNGKGKWWRRWVWGIIQEGGGSQRGANYKERLASALWVKLVFSHHLSFSAVMKCKPYLHLEEK